MILVSLAYGGTTVNVCDKDSKLAGSQGYTLDGTFYKPSLLNQPNITLSGKALIKARSLTLEIDRDDIYSFGTNDVTVNIYLWNENSSSSKFIIFKGVGTLKSYDSIKYVYSCDSDRYSLDDDLLSIAPNLKDNSGDADSTTDERVYPMDFGYVKYVAPLQLAVLCGSGCGGTYFSDGDVKTAYDGGIETNFTQSSSSTTVSKDGKAVTYDFLVDIDASTSAGGSATGKEDARTNITTFYDTTAPSSTSNYLIEGDLWYNTTSGLNKPYRWNGTDWTTQALEDGRVASGLNDSGVSVGGVSTTNTTIATGSSGITEMQGSKQIIRNISTSKPTEVITFNAPIKDASLTNQNIQLSDLGSVDGRVYFYNWISSSWSKRASIGLDTGWGSNAIMNAGNGSASNAVAGMYGESGSNFGAGGYSYSNIGVTGSSNTGTGVQGSTSNGIKGVYGVSSGTNGIGVEGYALGYIGVQGRTFSGQAIHAEVQATANPIITSETAHVTFNTTNHNTATNGVFSHYSANPAMLVDSAGDAYWNKGGGTTWTKWSP